MTATDDTIRYLNKTGLPAGFLDNMNREQLGAIVKQVREVLDDLDETECEMNGTSLPLLLGNTLEIHRCSRCPRSYTAPAWRVMVWKDDGAWNVCPHCAADDPELSIWQSYCQVTEMVDALMQAAPDQVTRNHLKASLQNTADHFSAWRWPEDQD